MLWFNIWSTFGGSNMKLKFSTWLNYLEEQYGDRPAVTGANTLTYYELINHSRRCAMTLNMVGVKNNHPLSSTNTRYSYHQHKLPLLETFGNIMETLCSKWGLETRWKRILSGTFDHFRLLSKKGKTADK